MSLTEDEKKIIEAANNYDEVDDNCPRCQASHHRSVPLGQLGQKRYVRCRSCHFDYTV